jgi:hypothetical protein
MLWTFWNMNKLHKQTPKLTLDNRSLGELGNFFVVMVCHGHGSLVQPSQPETRSNYRLEMDNLQAEVQETTTGLPFEHCSLLHQTTGRSHATLGCQKVVSPAVVKYQEMLRRMYMYNYD